jgi:putative NADH-flavin reductase
MYKIIVFGATGGTGKLVTEQALKGGHDVTVVVRNPNVFTLQHPNLEIVAGDVFELPTFEKSLKDKDVVVSCLGIHNREPTTLYSEGVSNIIQAMHLHNVKRIICLSAGAVIVPPKGSKISKFFTKNILQKIFKYLYADMLIMEKILKATTLNYTIVRPPWLRDTKHTGIYRMATNEHLHHPTKISRSDLADFIVTHLANEQTFQSTIELSY